MAVTEVKALVDLLGQVLQDDDRDNESRHDSFSPSGWEAAWEAAQDELAPSAEIKKAAETLVWCELLQQSMGWLLLTHIGILMGSFGQVMSQGVCLLSWGIFSLEAVLKYGRSWAHNHYFRDVPCAYVPLHREEAHNSLAFFGLFVLSATLLELSLYVPYIYSSVRYYLHHTKCYQYEEDSDCPDGTTRLIEMLVVSVVIVCLHWISSLATVYAFKPLWYGYYCSDSCKGTFSYEEAADLAIQSSRKIHNQEERF